MSDFVVFFTLDSLVLITVHSFFSYPSLRFTSIIGWRLIGARRGEFFVEHFAILVNSVSLKIV